MKKLTLALIILIVSVSVANAQEGDVKTKFYNFDDLLINGAYQKPQVLYTDSKQKIRFEKLLDLKKDFLVKLKESAKETTLR
jgi:hypothetical protein